jgi:translocator assembly and maintenance protein 41
LYLAGRLHKPTLPITPNPPDQLVEAQTSNLQAAMAAALLLLPPDSSNSIPWSTFYSQVASLSYTGDFRMQVGGEDPLKISKLVQAPGQLEQFQSLYKLILQPLKQSSILSPNERTLEWNATDPSMREYLAQQLPVRTRQNVDDLAKVLAAIVAPAARNQSFKGVFTLGFCRSMQ